MIIDRQKSKWVLMIWSKGDKMSKSTKFRIEELVVASNATVSGSFGTEGWEMFIGAYFPAMDNGIIGLEYSIDGGTTWVPILDPIDGQDLIVVASGSDPGAIDISDYIRFVPSNDLHLLRFTCAAQASGAVTITVVFRG